MREQAKQAPAFRPVEDVRSARPYFLTRNPLTDPRRGGWRASPPSS